MIRILLDQGLPRSAGKLLSGVNWDVVHVGDLSLSQAADERILAYCSAENRVCVTLDADFHALLARSGARQPSVIRIRREGLDARALANLLIDMWPRIQQNATEGALITVTEKSIRVRALPVGGKR